MRARKWTQPQKQWGKQRVMLTVKVDHEFAQAVRQYAKEQSALTGERVTQAMVISQLALGVEPRLRQLVREYKSQSS